MIQKSPQLLLLVLAALVIIVSSPTASGAAHDSTGAIVGVVSDTTTAKPLPGASLSLAEPNRAAGADESGRFSFAALPPGKYSLTATYVGYTRVDIQITVRAGETTSVNVALQPTLTPATNIYVHGERDIATEGDGTGTVVVDAQTIRDRPAGLNDISRSVAGMVHVARFDDRYPSLVVRGGSPIENAFYVDNIPLANISHYPSQGSSAGPLGVLNTFLIDNATFYAGGFPVTYGDRMSSVFDISLRSGSRDDFHGQAVLDVTGATLNLEGPLADGRVSYLVSARRGFLDLMLNALNIDASPNYSDLQTKVTYYCDSSLDISLLGIVGTGDIFFSEQVSAQESIDFFGNADYTSGTVGLTADHRSQDVHSLSTVAITGTTWKDDHYFTASGDSLYQNSSSEHFFTLRHAVERTLSTSWALEYGAEYRLKNADYDFSLRPFNDPDGYSNETVIVDTTHTYFTPSAWTRSEWRLTSWLSTHLGLRWDFSSFFERVNWSPRLGLRVRLSDRNAFTLSTGIYYQSLPLMLAFQHESNVHLPDPRATHLTLGYSHHVADWARLNVETFYKRYKNLPMDPTQPTAFILDELVYNYGVFPGHVPLVASGESRVTGLEVATETSVGKTLRLFLSGSWSSAKYLDYHGTWRHRVIDNEIAFDLESQWQPTPAWQLSARWVFGGGRPYTPYNVSMSKLFGGAVYLHREANTVRYPDYHSLNIRIQREFTFSGSNLIVYSELWNSYDRSNIAGQYWDSDDNEITTVQQFPRLPIIGLEYQF